MWYDIYLSMGCRDLPDLEDLFQDVPLLADPAFQKKFLIPFPVGEGGRADVPIMAGVSSLL